MICMSMADQHPVKGKSRGIYNVSIALANEFMRRGVELRVLGNKDIATDIFNSTSSDVKFFNWVNGSQLGRIVWDQWKVYDAADACGADLLILPKGYMSFLRRPKIKTLAYVHDVIIAHLASKYPHMVSKAETVYFTNSLRATLKHADIIVTNSAFSRSEILKWQRFQSLPSREIHVVGYGIPHNQSPDETNHSGVLLMLQSPPYKLWNQTMAMIQKIAALTVSDTKFTTVGSAPIGMVLPQGINWQHYGHVTRAQLTIHLKSSKVLVYSSEYEGFGIPPIEAIQAGVVPVYSNIPVLREVMGNAGFPFENGNLQSLTIALQSALATPLDTVVSWASALSAKHSIKQTVDRITTLLK